MDGQDIFSLFEGVNPRHPENPVQVISVGGTPGFLEYHPAPEGIKPTVWSEEDRSGFEVGGIEFLDPLTGEKFYIERLNNGDWV